MQNFHSTYCEEATDVYEPNKLFYNVSLSSWSSFSMGAVDIPIYTNLVVQFCVLNKRIIKTWKAFSSAAFPLQFLPGKISSQEIKISPLVSQVAPAWEPLL